MLSFDDPPNMLSSASAGLMLVSDLFYGNFFIKFVGMFFAFVCMFLFFSMFLHIYKVV